MQIRFSIRWIALLAASCVVGCGKPYEVVPVEGVVKLDGKPMVDVEVYFSPDVGIQEKSPPMSRAKTDAEGRFRLQCDDGEMGAVLGKHLVTVQRHRPRPVPGEPKPPPAPLVPLKYQVATQSPLKFEVKKEKKDYDIIMKSGGS